MKFFKKGELKLLWPFYLDALISTVLFFIPIFLVIYFRDLGFSLFQIGLLVGVAPLVGLLFEVPTGAVADLYGRKFSVLFGAFIELIAIVLLFFYTDFYVVLALFGLLGFGGTFTSGAAGAWVVDLIKHEKKHFLKSYFVKSQSLANVGLVFSGLIGAWFVGVFGLSIIWITAAVSVLISIIILSFAKEYFVPVKSGFGGAVRGVWAHSGEAIRYSRRHRVILYFFIASMILVLAGSFGGDLAWVPFLQSFGFPDYAFGFVWSGISALGIVAPLIASKFFKEGNERKFILGSLFAVALITMLVLFVNNLIFALVILFAVAFVDEFRAPAQRTYFHSHVPSLLRASVGSVEGMFVSFVAIFGPPLAGYMVDIIGPQYAIFISGVLTVPAAVTYYLVKKHKEGDGGL